jgi:hypothetical protein
MTDKRPEDMTPEELGELKIEFAPGCFDHMDITQAELDELMADIKNMIATGAIFENSEPLTEEAFNELPPEIQEQLSQSIDQLETADERRRRLN